MVTIGWLMLPLVEILRTAYSRDPGIVGAVDIADEDDARARSALAGDTL